MNRPLSRAVVVLGFCLGTFLTAALQLHAADTPKSAASRAVEPATPEVPPSVVAAMQDGRYADAAKELDALIKLAKTTEEVRAYFVMLRGTALRLDKKLDEAREVLSASLKAAPKGRWAAKVRSELVAVEVAAGKFAAAEELARLETESLLDDGRKDRLAEVYRGFADRLLKPDLPTTPADPEGAYALLLQARALAKGEILRASLLFAMGGASQRAGNPGRAITDFQTYLKEYKNGADRYAVRYALAESQLSAGQALPARLTWTDLARDLEKVDTTEAADLRARSLYGIAKSHGIPNPPDDAQLNLGVAALKRLIATYPSHPLAVRASYEIASSYLARGKSQEARSALNAFLKADEAREGDPITPERMSLRMAAQFQDGQILQAQGRFGEAITAYKAYLAKYPNGPQSADAQRAVLDAELQIAYEYKGREKYADARPAFLAFAARNPLDPRVPQVLFEVGHCFSHERKYDEAIAAWATLAGKFPGTEPAAHGIYLTGWMLEHEKADPIAALAMYNKVPAGSPYHAEAQQRIALMQAKSLTVVTERAFRSGEVPTLKIGTRNLEKLTFTAYKIDPETYFRKKHTLGGVEALDIGLVAPDLEWKADVPAYARYKPVESLYDLKKLDMPGVYVVKVSDEKTLQATTLVLCSDIDAIVKTSREQLLVYVQDMKTGKGRGNARVLVSDDTGVILDARAGKDGVLLRDWSEPLPPGQGAANVPAPESQAQDAAAAGKPHLPQGQLRYLVLDEGNAAGSGLDVPNKIAQGLTPRAYLYTDRPAYRPGSDVELRGVVREVVKGQYSNAPGASYKLEVYDARGRKFVDRPITLSGYGTFHESLPLDEGAPVGSYRVRLFQPGKSQFEGLFVVQAYQLEKIDLTFDLPKTVYYRGQTIKGSLIAKYQYGTPLAQRAITLALPDGRILEGKTDNSGKFAFELETTGFAEEQTLPLVARLPQDNVAVAANVILAVRGFRIDVTTIRDVYLDGESFAVNLATLDAQGEPTGRKLDVALLKRVVLNGQVAEREVSRESVSTDKKTGKASIRLKVEDEDGGEFIVRASGTDQFDNAIIGQHVLLISGKKDATKLRLLTDRTAYKVGETADVRLVNRGAASTVLLTWEADRVLSYKLVEVKEGENRVSWDVDGAQFPNFTLAADRMAPPRFDQARLDVRVERDLRVTIKPKNESVGPNGEVEVEVVTTDQNGKPVAAEVSLALVDKSLLRLFADRLPTISDYFYNQTRTSSFATESSATFRYTPQTAAVSEAVVEAAAQDEASKVDALRLGEKRAEANVQMFSRQAAGRAANFSYAVPASAPAAPDLAMKYVSDAASKTEEAKDALRDGAEVAADRKAGLGVAKSKSAPSRRAAMGGGMGGGMGGMKGAAAASPRERFVETAYWNPSVVTGKDGRATVKFRAPAALSEYRFTARGVTGSDTLVGQSTADLAVRKDFFVDLKAPTTLTQGDKPRLSAEVHHKGVNGPATLRLTASMPVAARSSSRRRSTSRVTAWSRSSSTPSTCRTTTR